MGENLSGLIACASLSDLWFAYASFNHVGTGEDLRQTGEEFTRLLGNIGVTLPGYYDVEWLIQEYHKRV